jgi:DNA topoisomerase IB
MENKSYGITTLKKEHIKFEPTGHKFTIEFIGKKGILNRFSDDNPLIGMLLKTLIKHSSKDGFIYKYKQDGNEMFITPDHIQTFFQDKYNSYITPKMFRTWYGNYYMLVHLRNLFNSGKLKSRCTKTEIREIVNSISEHVSSKLNNTPTISKQSYIDNKILDVVIKNPYRLASNIPDDINGQHKFLHKIILKLRQAKP